MNGLNEQKIRNMIGKAVDDSIVEILPPVVDRSITIALITTRELVLKDFAYDRDHRRVLEASNLIIQNLAGSLALVTCREPLRMSLSNNIKKAFDTCLEESIDTQGERLNDNQIAELAVSVSRENLELGCMLIKRQVIEKALKKVREDLAIQGAIEKRKRAQELGLTSYKDEEISH